MCCPTPPPRSCAASQPRTAHPHRRSQPNTYANGSEASRRPKLRRHPEGRHAARRPAWLEPYGASRAWRAETWGSIVALHGRYRRALGALKDGWWNDPAQLETLCALASWRAQLDTAGQDPREELTFHDRLADYAQTLKAEAGGIAATWAPGAPPAEWRA